MWDTDGCGNDKYPNKYNIYIYICMYFFFFTKYKYGNKLLDVKFPYLWLDYIPTQFFLPNISNLNNINPQGQFEGNDKIAKNFKINTNSSTTVFFFSGISRCNIIHTVWGIPNRATLEQGACCVEMQHMSGNVHQINDRRRPMIPTTPNIKRTLLICDILAINHKFLGFL